jgi:hypothetical protein
MFSCSGVLKPKSRLYYLLAAWVISTSGCDVTMLNFVPRVHISLSANVPHVWAFSKTKVLPPESRLYLAYNLSCKYFRFRHRHANFGTARAYFCVGQRSIVLGVLGNLESRCYLAYSMGCKYFRFRRRYIELIIYQSWSATYSYLCLCKYTKWHRYSDFFSTSTVCTPLGYDISFFTSAILICGKTTR